MKYLSKYKFIKENEEPKEENPIDFGDDIDIKTGRQYTFHNRKQGTDMASIKQKWNANQQQNKTEVLIELNKSKAMMDLLALVPDKKDIYKVENSGFITFNRAFGQRNTIEKNGDSYLVTSYEVDGKVENEFNSLEEALRGLWIHLISRKVPSAYDDEITRELLQHKYWGERKSLEEIINLEINPSEALPYEEIEERLNSIFHDLGIKLELGSIVDKKSDNNITTININRNLLAVPESLLWSLIINYGDYGTSKVAFFSDGGFNYPNNSKPNNRVIKLTHKRMSDYLPARIKEEAIKKVIQYVESTFSSDNEPMVSVGDMHPAKSLALAINLLIINFCKYQSKLYKISNQEDVSTKALYEAIKKSKKRNYFFYFIKYDMPDLWDKLINIGNQKAMEDAVKSHKQK